MSSGAEWRLCSWFEQPSTADDRRELAELVKPLLDSLQPVWHPLGFIHVRLATLSSHETIRLHLWPADQKHVAEQFDKVHDHLFNVASRVVSGEVTNIRYCFTPDDDGDWREVRVRYGEKQSELQETGLTGRLDALGSTQYCAPATYDVPRYELHETVLSGVSSALTVVRTDSASSYFPRAIFRRDSPLPPPRAPVACSQRQWRDLLGELIPI
ncbi:hypothetical protein NK553_04600 [Pseudomonas sp. ZM23]|uniref:Uncharacterized protein n=1 Tax=Pseudomonas triclosanedens TaxID=2961893 RepID=A0ABY6ZUP8_9PSED|nr:hypothetical protein [Pseudomonas triclosanedens]MCP8463223.1 hypothetical protein [Pseudomonas triclosanedens]MCP8469718.1 hypothetical protein [Pseudomonas triclosanedens]MCP8474024.1 hypothetical protein [Pseudomonas triclosanedens]WAI48578.1 hypothetical protein OU419_22895 [Pseudomonas triclosanedens]